MVLSPLSSHTSARKPVGKQFDRKPTQQGSRHLESPPTGTFDATTVAATSSPIINQGTYAIGSRLENVRRALASGGPSCVPDPGRVRRRGGVANIECSTRAAMRRGMVDSGGDSVRRVCGESRRGAPRHDDTIPVLCRELHDRVRCPIVALLPAAALVARGIGAGEEVLEDGVLAVKRNEDGLRVLEVAVVGRIDAARIDDRRMPGRGSRGC
jgi:hypothetical protein